MISNKQVGLISYKPDKAYNGYTLFTPNSNPNSTAYLIDMEGRIVKAWNLGGWVRSHVEFLPNGNLFGGLMLPHKNLADKAFMGGTVIEMDWDGNIVWQYEDDDADTHDRIRLQNGNTMILHHVDIPKDLDKKIKGGVKGSTGTLGLKHMQGFVMQEITPDGKIVNEIDVSSKADPKLDILTPLMARHFWPGFNSLEELSNGDIMASSYACSNIYIFDRQTGDIKWRWGHGIVSFPHDPMELDNGNILFLDNQRFPLTLLPPDGSRVVEVNPKTEKIEWEFKTENPIDFHNTYAGGVQRLPNGNTLICQGAKGHFFEITREGEIVWEYVNPFFWKNNIALAFGTSNMTFRCMRYGPEHPALGGKVLDPAAYNNWNILYASSSASGVSGAQVPSNSLTDSGMNAPTMDSQTTEEPDSSNEQDEVDERAQLLGY